MARIGDVHEALAGAVAAAGRAVASVGADCCQSIAVMAGLRRAGIDPVLVWLDAHGDFNTWDTSPSGFVGGMPLAMLTGRGDQRLLERLALSPVTDTDVFLCDARDLDPGERAALEASRVTRISHVDDLVARLPLERPLYVHLDMDVIDAAEAPAMLYPVAGGPGVGALTRAAAALRATGRIAAVSVTTWDLESDGDGATGRACGGIFDTLVGNT